MLEIIKKTLSKTNFDEEVKHFLLFKWEIESTKETNRGILVTFKRDTNIPNYQQIIALEEKYFALKMPNFLAVYILIGNSLTFLTTFLVWWLIMRVDLLMTFLISLVPGLILFLIAAILFFVKSYKVNNIIKNGENIKKDILEKMSKL